MDSDALKVYRQGFDPNGAAILQGDTYRVSLEKTDYAYIVTQYAINGDGSTGAVLGQHTLYIPAKDPGAESVSGYDELDDPMLVQDDLGYVGFAAARGMNVTYSNITFTTSAWDAAGWHPQEPEQVAADYQITSPATAAENSYTLVFKANADGSANVYQNGALVEVRGGRHRQHRILRDLSHRRGHHLPGGVHPRPRLQDLGLRGAEQL